MLTENYREALQQGADGWIDDAVAFTADWGFRLADVKVPALLWHGKEDVFSPMTHSRWLAARIPGSTLRTAENKAHFDAMSMLPDIVPWLKQPEYQITTTAVRARG
jgi:pimeloyl-ACP methyl ester carboxylesterase